MTYRPRRMRFGIFLAPFHTPGENPTLALERDAALIEELDRLGYDEAWIGEHHSVGWEFIPDPAMFAAHMAARTKQIKLGTGVVSLPYHNPFMVADRMMFLDHLTRGRALFGVGPGALASDAYMMGIDATTQRTRMVEALDAILPLLRGERVTMETDWFTLRDARLQLAGYTQPHLPVAVAHSLSPSGPQTAGRFGIGMLSVATAAPGGIGSLDGAWQWAEEAAEESGAEINRDEWRVTMYFHLADSKEEALAQTAEACIAYNQGYTGSLGIRFGEGEDTIEAMVERGGAIVGTPDDAIEGIERLLEISGGFGGLLCSMREFATTEQTLYSFELFARHVMPRFQGQIEPIEGALHWARDNVRTLFGPQAAAQRKAFEDAGMEAPGRSRGRPATPSQQ